MKSSCRLVDAKDFDSLITRALLRKTPVLLFSFGLRKRVILRRLIASVAPDSRANLVNAPLYVNTRPALGTVEIWLYCRRLDTQLRRSRKRLGLVAIADLQRIAGRFRQRKLMDLKALAQEIQLPVIVTQTPRWDSCSDQMIEVKRPKSRC